MLSGKEDLLRALIEAFLMEKGTKEFYSQASDKTGNLEVKNAFSELSRWEGKHMDFIQFLYQSIQGDREMKTFEEFKKKTAAPVTEAGIPAKDLLQSNRFQKSMVREYTITDEKQALRLAMEIEEKAYNLYRKFSSHAEDTNAQVVFKEMMEQELKHVEYLKGLREKFIKVY